MERVKARKQKRPPSTPPTVRNIHLYWPIPFADKVDAISAERGMSKQEILLRVVYHAIESNMIYDWITKPVTSVAERSTPIAAAT